MKLTANKKYFMHFHIAGFSYHEGCEVLNELQIGSPLRLIHEDENKYDPNAIAILYEETMLGYVPKERNSIIAMLIEMGYPNIFEARVQTLNTDAHPEKQVGVIVYIKRKEF